MNIAIVGAGWMGCHLSEYLIKKSHNIQLFDGSGIFTGSSFYNQNRLHLGFHYSRNKKTRQLCLNTFERFSKEYSHIIDSVPNNLYVVPKDKSIIDFDTYKSIFEYEKIQFNTVNTHNLNNIEGCISVEERHINPYKAKQYFESSLSNYLNIQNITEGNIGVLTKNFDLVFNLTNNRINTIEDHYYELSIVLVYEKINQTDFGAITMVDGPLFSIYPYKDSDYTLTDVEYTPLYTSNSLKELEEFKSNIDKDIIERTKNLIEQKVLLYYNNFKSDFEYKNYYTSIKVKRLSNSADRYPIITKKDNLISAVTGKIQGIYILEDYVNEIISR